MKKNLYNILEIPKNSSPDEIKNAYKKMVLKWHPDKNPNNIKEAEEKFRNIQIAYEILGNDDKKKEYDNMSNIEQIELYDSIKTYLLNKYPTINSYYDFFINTFYSGEEIEFKKNIQSFDFSKIYHNILNTISSFDFNNDFSNEINNEINNKINNDININVSINTTLLERYNDKYVKITINRDTKKDFIAYIRLLETEIIFEKEGEIYNGIEGDLNIIISCEKHQKFNVLKNDLYIFEEISLYQYLYGGNIIIKHIDDTDINISFNSFINHSPLYILKNYGLPQINLNENTDEQNDLDNENNLDKKDDLDRKDDFNRKDIFNRKSRGDLIIYFTIKEINNTNFIEKIQNIYF